MLRRSATTLTLALRLPAAGRPAPLPLPLPLSHARALSTSLSGHKHDPKNSALLPFEFTTANYERVNAILAKYPTNYKQSGASFPPSSVGRFSRRTGN